MKRRDFLRLVGSGAGAVGLAACGGEWSVPDRLVALALQGPGISRSVRTVCGLCEGGCGMTVRLVDDLPVGLKGNEQHPLNRGGLCPVGMSALDLLYAPNRLRGPMQRDREGEYHAVAWEKAIGAIGSRLAEIKSTGNGHKVAFLTAEPSQLFHEFTRRFAHSLGSTSVARLDAMSAVPFTLTQGLDVSPGFDLERTDLVFSFGLDLFEDGPAPIHAIAALIGSRSTENRGTLLYAGSRMSPTAAKAADRLPIAPGTCGALALGVAHVLVREGRYDRQFVTDHTLGFEDWTDEAGRRHQGFRRLLMEQYYPSRVAQICRCDAAAVMRLARRFGSARAPVAVAGGEAVSGSNGAWTSFAVHAINALVGSINRPGGVVLPPEIPFLPLDSPAGSAGPSVFAPPPDSPTLDMDPVEALLDRMSGEELPVDLLFVVGGNPVATGPLGERLGSAMDRIPMVVSVNRFLNETAARADFVLPDHMFLESWRETTTPATTSFGTLGLGSPVIEPLYDTRHPGDLMLELARTVGGSTAEALPWSSYVDYMKGRLEGLAISGQGAFISGSFEESWVQFLEERGWRFVDSGSPGSYWDSLAAAAGWWDPAGRGTGWNRMLRTPSGRFEFFSRRLESHLMKLGAEPGTPDGETDALSRGIRRLDLAASADEVCLPHYEPPVETGDGELTLVPFRPITARSELATSSPMVLEMFGYAVLSGWETWVELAPKTAHELNLEYGDRVAVESGTGRVEAVVRLQPGTAHGVVHMPMGLGRSQPGGAGAGIGSSPTGILEAVRDPLTGRMSLNSTRVRLRLLRRRERGGPPPMNGGHS